MTAKPMTGSKAVDGDEHDPAEIEKSADLTTAEEGDADAKVIGSGKGDKLAAG